MYDTFGKPLSAAASSSSPIKMPLGDKQPMVNGVDVPRPHILPTSSLRFSDVIDEFFNLSEPIGETGVVTVLNQKINEEEAGPSGGLQRENLI